MGDEAGRMTAEPCAGCGCKWKRCKPDTPGSNTGVVVCAYCGTFQSRYEFTDLPAAPVGSDEGKTDLPDAGEILHRINTQTSLGSVFGSQTDPETLYMPTSLICRLLDGEDA